MFIVTIVRILRHCATDHIYKHIYVYIYNELIIVFIFFHP